MKLRGEKCPNKTSIFFLFFFASFSLLFALLFSHPIYSLGQFFWLPVTTFGCCNCQNTETPVKPPSFWTDHIAEKKRNSVRNDSTRIFFYNWLTVLVVQGMFGGRENVYSYFLSMITWPNVMLFHFNFSNFAFK